MDFIREQAMDGTLIAHVEGGVPNITVQVGRRNAFTLGELIYFFEYACGLSGYLLDVNPFDQPASRPIRRTCSPCSASPAMRNWGGACSRSSAGELALLYKKEVVFSPLPFLAIYGILKGELSSTPFFQRSDILWLD